VPELVALDLPALVVAAGYPGTAAIPAVNYLLGLLALKLTGIRRVSHVDDPAADPAAALFAGLSALPKTTALSSYSLPARPHPPARPADRAGHGDARRQPDHRRGRRPRPESRRLCR
jgi:hypothetical protein